MTSWEASAARRYHDRTKHSYESVRRSRHRLDWANRPSPFKDYVGLDPVPLPDSPLGRVLRWGAGVIRSRRYPGGETHHFRTYSSAGALYPIEVYVALERGLYHFHPLELALRRLRPDDVRANLVPGAGAVAVLTGILWRTAWKYQARGYRHLYWDAGTMLANLLAVSAAEGVEASVATAFVDDAVNFVVGTDGRREAAVALLALGHDGHERPRELEPLAAEAKPLSRSETEYPEAHELHRRSGLSSDDDVRRYRAGYAPQTESQRPLADLERVLRRRGSIRDFALEPIPRTALRSILERAGGPIPADVPPSNELFLIVAAVDGLEPGTYRFDPVNGFELLRRGDFRAQAAYLVLEQELGYRAAATVFLLADLPAVVGAHGDRGYRAAHLEAGIRAGRIYLGAFGHGLGATASTFYDDDVTAFLAPATAKAPLLAVAVGAMQAR